MFMSPNGQGRQRQGIPLLVRFIPIAIALVVMLIYMNTAEEFENPETGERSRVALSLDQEATLGLQAFQQILQSSRVLTSGPEVELIEHVAERLIAVVDPESKEFPWQVAVIDDPQQNAFCLPGGKIAVYTGILPICKNPDGLATVMAHEIAHATSRHGARRVFDSNALQIALGGVQGSLAGMEPEQQRIVVGLLGAGAQYGVMLPFSRKHELEADSIGIIYMARAGFDPRESVEFWQRMGEAAQGQKPPEMLSTHPADQTRIANLQRLMPEALQIYRETLQLNQTESPPLEIGPSREELFR